MNKQMLKSTFVLFTVTLICGLLLGFVNELSREPIRLQEEKTLKESMQIIFEEADDFAETVFESNIITGFYTAVQNGSEIGYIIETKSMGYGDYVTVITGIYMDGTVAGVKITDHSETAGLGANAEKDSFLNQYEGATQTLSVVKLNPGSNEVEAITSATITTNAVTESVNKALDFFNVNLGGGN